MIVEFTNHLGSWVHVQTQSTQSILKGKDGSYCDAADEEQIL